MIVKLNGVPSFKISAGFNQLDSVHSTPHTGIDIAMPEGTDIFSPVSGFVERVADYGHTGLGKAIFLRLQDGREIILGHLSDIKVKAGEIIQKGELLADSGNTGHSTGAHLHVGLVDKAGHFLDPSVFANFWTQVQQKSWIERMTDQAISSATHNFLTMLKSIGLYIVDESFCLATIGGLGCLFLIMGGSTRARKWLYWIIFGFLLIQIGKAVAGL